MLKTTLVAMTLLGCDCDAKMCEFISETPAQWSSVADCEAAMQARVTRNSNLGYPLISGVCRVVEQPAQTVALPAQPAPVVNVAEVPAVSGTDKTSGSWYDSRPAAARRCFARQRTAIRA